jgi:naphthalene 1,2-dioxygenase ferredoxin component
MDGKDDWQDLIALGDLEENWVTRVNHGARKLAVYDTPSGHYVSLALCNHGGADLCDGYFDGHFIECPLHQGAFDVRDGRPVSAPATRPMKVFQCRRANGRLQILLSRAGAATGG